MKNYVELALRTESTNWYQPDTRLLHASMGLVTETVELLNATDDQNFVEELGDVLWYVAIACDTLGVTFEEAQEIVFDRQWTAFCPLADMITSAAEITDLLKKSIFYGKSLDTKKVVVHLGNIIDCVGMVGGVSLEEVQDANILKLEKRFPELKFSKDAALNRDVKHEISHL